MVYRNKSIMLYIFNKTIPDSKSILNALTILYGINKYQSKIICKNMGINPESTVLQLNKNQVNRLLKYLYKSKKIESAFMTKKALQLTELLKIKTIRSIRLNQGLPVRGQRTHTNAKTARKPFLRHKKKKKKKNKFKKKEKKKLCTRRVNR